MSMCVCARVCVCVCVCVLCGHFAFVFCKLGMTKHKFPSQKRNSFVATVTVAGASEDKAKAHAPWVMAACMREVQYSTQCDVTYTSDNSRALPVTPRTQQSTHKKHETHTADLN